MATDSLQIDFNIATLTYKADNLKLPRFLAQHLKLKSMHVNTGHIYQLLLQHLLVGANSYGHRAFSLQFGINFHIIFVMHHR